MSATDHDAIYEKKKWISITGLCNNNCLFCLDKDRPDRQHKAAAELKDEILAASKEGYERLVLSGGDPTVHPDVISLVRFGKECGFRKVQIITNGRRFSDRGFAEGIAEAGIDEITFSMHSHIESVHDTLTQVPGSFRQIVKGIRNVRSLDKGIIINTDTCITGLNYKDLPKTIRFIHKALDIWEVNLMSMVPQGNAWRYRDRILYDFEDVAGPVHEVINYCRDKGLVLWLSRFPAEYLKGYERYMESPYKMVDDVRGSAEHVFLGKPVPDCFGSKCAYCGISRICPAIREINMQFLGLKEKPEVYDAIEITEQNYKDLKSAARGKNRAVFKFKNPPKRIADYDVPRMSDAVRELRKAVRGLEEWAVMDIPPCLLFSEKIITQKPYLKDSYIREGSLDYVSIAEDISLKAKFKPKECKGCIAYEICEGIFINYARLYGTGEFNKDNLPESFSRPKEVRINLECNQDCLFCNTNEESEGVVLSDERILEAVRDQSCLYLIISGKEPTLHKKLFKYIMEASASGKQKIELQTNAVRCEDLSFVKMLKKAGLTHAFVSLHSHDKEISERITRAPNTFEKTVRGIRNLMEEGIGVTINCVINSYNYKGLPEFSRFVAEVLGVRRVVLSYVSPVVSALEHPEIIPRISDVLPFLRSAMDYLSVKGIDVHLPARCGIPLCFLAGYEQYSDEYADSERWKDEADKLKAKACSSCKYNDRCSGLWEEYVKIYGDSEVAPVSDELRHIEINLGKRCNNRCSFCMIPEESKYRDFAGISELKEDIRGARKKGFLSIGFSGGEPTLYPYLEDAIRYSRQEGFKDISIVTNGRKLSSKRFTERLLRAGLKRVLVSFHSRYEDVCDDLCSVKGAYREKLLGLMSLMELRKRHYTKVAVNILLTKKNISHLAETVDFFRKFGVDDIRINSVNPYGNALKNFEEIVPSYGEINKAISELSDFLRKCALMGGADPQYSGVPGSVNDIERASANCQNSLDSTLGGDTFGKKGSGRLRISFGDLPMCVSDPSAIPAIPGVEYSSQFPDDIAEVVSFNDSSSSESFDFRKEKLESLKVRDQKCRKCIDFFSCGGIWSGYAEKRGFEEFTPKIVRIRPDPAAEILIRAVEAGVKPAAKIEPVRLSDVGALTAKLKKKHLAYAVQKRRYRIAEDGFRFIEAVDESRSNYTSVFISKDMGVLKRLLRMTLRERDRNDRKAVAEIGKILGYPECCVRSFSERKDYRDDLAENLIIRGKTSGKSDWRLNNVCGPLRLVHFFPCSYSCSNAAGYAENILSLYEDPAIVRSLLCSAVIYFDFNNFIILSGRRKGQALFYEKVVPSNALMADFMHVNPKIMKRSVELLKKGDSLILKDNPEIYKGGRLLGTTGGRMFDFCDEKGCVSSGNKKVQ